MLDDGGDLLGFFRGIQAGRRARGIHDAWAACRRPFARS
jgi:hypothetical protein